MSKMAWLSIIIIVLATFGASFAEDECDPKYANIDQDHTMCMVKQSCSGYKLISKTIYFISLL